MGSGDLTNEGWALSRFLNSAPFSANTTISSMAAHLSRSDGGSADAFY